MPDNSDALGAREKPFGVINPRGWNRFGTSGGGTGTGGVGWLLDLADRERGFLSKADRELLLEMQELDLSDTTQRNARTRIRNRVLSAYFDARYLRYIPERDRELIFKNAREEGYDLQLRHCVKEFVRFTYRGLLEDEHDIDITEILETAIQEAEQEHATAAGENATFQVDINVNRIPGDSITDLERRYTDHKYIGPDELEVLVNSDHTNSDEDVVDAADIGLVDALYYDAHQPESDPNGYGWEDPDRDEAEEIVERLRSVFEEYSVETYDDLKETVDRLGAFDEETFGDLTKDLNRISRAAPNFPTQMASEADLPEQDMELLHDILWNPDNIDVEEALEREARPRTAGDEWSPADDESLQRFIARVEVAREAAEGFTSGGEEGRARWNEVLEITDFDEDEWSEYMQEKRVQRCVSELEEFIEEGELDGDRIRNAPSLEEYWESLPQEEVHPYQVPWFDYEPDTIEAALKTIRRTDDVEASE
jgi:hypothetical protein